MDEKELAGELNVHEPRSWEHTVPSPELCRLGHHLYERRDDVIARADSLNPAGGFQVDAATQASTARVIALSTEAVARWMAGEGVEAAREIGREAAAIFGQLAIQRAAPLDEVTKRALRWRDAAWEVMTEIVAEHGFDQEVRFQARRMLQRSLDVTLVRLCEDFENERRLIDEELGKRQQELACAFSVHAPQYKTATFGFLHLIRCGSRPFAVATMGL